MTSVQAVAARTTAGAHPAEVASAPAAPRSETLATVQVLRGAAALLVLLGHTQGELARLTAGSMNPFQRVEGWPGGFGVDLFFAISGFIMVVSSRRQFAAPGARGVFLMRRVIRLVPLYWLATLLYVLVLMLGTSAHPAGLGGAVARSLLFVPYSIPEMHGGETFPVLDLGWSLNYEAFFYALFAICLAWPMRRAVSTLCVMLAVVVILGLLLPPEARALRFWCAPIVLEFLFGALVGVAWTRGVAMSAPSGVALAATALLLVALDPMGLCIKVGTLSTPNDLRRVLGWGMPALALLSVAVFWRRLALLQGRWLGALVLLGDASYALYLMHPFALIAVAKLWRRVHLDHFVAWPWLALALIAASITLGLLMHRYIEKPTTRWLLRRTRLSSPGAPR